MKYHSCLSLDNVQSEAEIDICCTINYFNNEYPTDHSTRREFHGTENRLVDELGNRSKFVCNRIPPGSVCFQEAKHH